MAGRKKLPTNIHILKGTARPSRINKNEPKPEIEIPEEPEHLSEEAAKEWNRISVVLRDLGLLSQIDMAALAIYCQTYGRMVKYEKIVKEKGELYKDPKGNVTLSPAMWVINKAIQQCHRMLVEFGMTPSSRSKVSASASKVIADNVNNKFSAYGS